MIRKSLYFWITVLFSLSFSVLGEQQCLFPPSVEGEDWDIFWAQHYVGADLLRTELKRPNVMKDENIASVVGVWDTSEVDHGEYVSNIIAGRRLSAIIPTQNPILYQDLDAGDDYTATYEEFSKKCRQNNNCPSYINNSMSWGGSSITHIASSLSTLGSTLVVAAGNGRFSVEPAQEEASLNKTIIVVASLAPDGSPSAFTNYGDAVTISAPSDTSLRSYDYEGNRTNFGFTSGAAPLVTGTLGGFTLLSRHHLSTRQADLLLRKTAVPLPNLPREHLMGAGMLNSYKIGMVALRIKEQCQRYSMESRRNRCLSGLLENDETYQFNEMSTRFFEEAMKSFPECLPKEETQSVDNCEKTKAFNNLRRSALLNPTDPKIWKAMVCVKEKSFEDKGIEEGGRIDFYRSLAKNLQEQKDNKEIIENICTNEQQASLTRYLPKSLLIHWLREKKCSSKTLEVALNSLFDNFSLSQELIDEIFAHPNMTEKTFAYASNNLFFFHLDNHEGTYPQALLEKIFDHQTLSKDILNRLIGIMFRLFPDKVFNPEDLVEQIFNHQNTTGHSIALMSHEISSMENFDKLSNPQDLFEKILNHPKVNKDTTSLTLTINNLSKTVVENKERFSHPRIFLDKMHEKLSKKIVENKGASHILQEWLKTIEARQKSLE